jgi:hypothetical protein
MSTNMLESWVPVRPAILEAEAGGIQEQPEQHE